MFGQHGVMVVGTAIPDPDRHCGRNAAAHRAAKVTEARRARQLVAVRLKIMNAKQTARRRFMRFMFRPTIGDMNSASIPTGATASPAFVAV